MAHVIFIILFAEGRLYIISCLSIFVVIPISIIGN